MAAWPTRTARTCTCPFVCLLHKSVTRVPHAGTFQRAAAAAAAPAVVALPAMAGHRGQVAVGGAVACRTATRGGSEVTPTRNSLGNGWARYRMLATTGPDQPVYSYGLCTVMVYIVISVWST